MPLDEGRFGRGEVVWDKEGRAVGLLVGGLMPQEGVESVLFVTPNEEVFENIRDSSQGSLAEPEKKNKQIKNHAVATPSIPQNPECSTSNKTRVIVQIDIL